MRTSSLNHTYKLVWSRVSNAWVAVSEIVKGKGKSKSQKVVALITSALFASASWAGPEGGVVTGGSGTISQSGAVTTINQSSQVLNLNWNTFNVAAHETVNFVQPSATALAVNQILDTNGSRILGNINANGQVWLINPNGVYFGQGATVNVGSLLASTLNPLANTYGTQVFGNGGTGSIVNEGTINANNGYVAFIGNTVSNTGTIQANGGTVAFGAGSQVSLKFADNQLLGLTVDQSTLNNLAENKGLIQANGGAVLLSAGARDSLLASVVNNEGVIEAKTVDHKAGTIMLMGGMVAGTTKVAGTLDASAETGNGGFIETSAATVKVADGTIITTKAENKDNGNGQSGTWLIDPTDFTITTGSAVQTSSGIGASTLSTNLGNGSVKIATDNTTGTQSGDIHVNGAVSWSANNTLTLSAYRNININREITATGASGKLALEYGQGAVAAGNTATYNVNSKVNLQAGDNFSTKFGSDGGTTQYKVITSLGSAGDAITAPATMTLQGINASPSGNYVLGADIDASATSSWNSGLGFTPIYIPSLNFTLDGLGHSVKNLTINRTTSNNVGLFNSIQGTLRNIGLEGGNISGWQAVGGLAGRTTYANISNVSSSANVTGQTIVGGLVGQADLSVIKNANASGAVTATNGGSAGGLIGYQTGSSSVIQNTFATGSVRGVSDVGGLIGLVTAGSVSDSYATGNVEGSQHNIGGLIGRTTYGMPIDINKVYATGNVTSVPAASYHVGGLVGFLDQGAGLARGYSSGSVTGGISGYSGALIGGLKGGASFLYYDSDFTGGLNAIGYSQGGSTVFLGAINAINRYTQSAYANLNFSSDWFMVDGSTRPLLRSEYSTNIKNANQLQLMAMDLGASYTLGNNINAIATAGTNVSGLWSSAGFSPIGAAANKFTGIFDGSGQTINNINISRAGVQYVGLFGYTEGTVKNLGMVGGSVSGHFDVGGLAGFNSGIMSNVYSTAQVNATGDTIGGLVGGNSGSITNAYATGSVAGRYSVGGLVGGNFGGNINNAYAAGRVTGSTVGGLVGAFGGGSINSSFWNSDTTGQTASGGGGLAKTTAQMQQLATFTGWNIAGQGGAYPILNFSGTGTTWTIGPLITTLNYRLSNINFTYKGEDYNLKDLWTPSNIFGSQDYSNWVAGTDYIFTQNGAQVTSFKNAGTYDNINIAIQKQGYVAASSGNTAGSLTINKANLTLNAVTDTKTYDANTISNVAVEKVGLKGNDSVTSLTQEFADKNVKGTNGSTLQVKTGYVVNDGNNGGNYNVTVNTASGTIKQATINYVKGLTAEDKVYDGKKDAKAVVTGAVFDGMVAGDDLSIASLDAAFADKHAGIGKEVSIGNIKLTGQDVNNYTLADNTAKTTATIKQVILSYVANPTVTFQGQPPILTGVMSGFVDGEGLSDLTGALTWSTNADLLNPGVYGMTGGGLSSQNYTFAQAKGNSTAVTVVAATPSQPVNNVTSNIQQPVQNPVNNPNSPPPSHIQVVTVNNSQVNPAAGNGGGSDADTPVTNQGSTLPLGNTGVTSTMTIVDGGVNVGNTLNNNQDN